LKAFVSKYGEFGEDASIEYLLAALAEVAFFIGLEKKLFLQFFLSTQVPGF